MHPVVSVWNVEKGRGEEQQRGLEQLVPMVQGAPGFVAGYWTSDQQMAARGWNACDLAQAAGRARLC